MAYLHTRQTTRVYQTSKQKHPTTSPKSVRWIQRRVEEHGRTQREIFGGRFLQELPETILGTQGCNHLKGDV